jgi:DNA mismatch endonuclease (patch repair protein)
MADNLTPEQRSRTMSLIRSRNTKPELVVRRLLHSRGLRFRLHLSALPGRPDLVFTAPRVVVFIDGDFWHGWWFPQWRDKMAPYWRAKIEGNRVRDARNARRLRRQGWRVVRIWEHRIKHDPDSCVDQIVEIIAEQERRLRPGRPRLPGPATTLAMKRRTPLQHGRSVRARAKIAFSG